MADLQGSLKYIINKYTNSSTSYENTNFILNIFNYVFFPLEFLLKQNSLAVNSSIMMQIISVVIIINFIFLKKSKIKLDNKIFTFLIFLNLIYFSILPQMLFNYGLNVRQKWMILPFLIYLLLFLANLVVQRKKI